MVSSLLLFELVLVGIALGSLYALAALGIVLIYRTTGVLNFAHGAIGMFTAFVAYQIGVVAGWPALLAVVLALLFAAAFGWMMERFTLRPLRERPVLTRVIVTLGWLLLLQAVAGLLFGDTSYHIPLQLFPQSGVRIAQLTLGYNQLANIIVAGLLAVGLGVFLRKSALGVAMRATSENPSAARLLGIDVNRVSAMAWIIGSVLAGITGLLLAPLTTLNTTDLTIIVIEALGAALIGGLTSLGWTFAGGILLGVAQSLLTLHALNLPNGARDVLTFAVILVVLLLRRDVRTLAISAVGGEGLG